MVDKGKLVDEEKIMQILNSRENRANRQKDLINTYKKSLISFTLNIPGEIKDSPLYRKVHGEGMRTIIVSLNKNNIDIIFKEEIYKTTGAEGFIVADADASDLKMLTLEIEDSHPLGRIFDVDVFDASFKQIGRSDLKAGPRKCLLCNKEVRLCMREKNHTYEELICRVIEMAEGYFRE